MATANGSFAATLEILRTLRGFAQPFQLHEWRKPPRGRCAVILANCVGGGVRGPSFRSGPQMPEPEAASRNTGTASMAGTVMRPYLEWGDDFSWQVEMDYYGLMIALAQHQKDYDIVNDSYLERATFDHGSARIGSAQFHTIVLPPLKVISRAAMKRILQFYENGGVVVAYGSLPSGFNR